MIHMLRLKNFYSFRDPVELNLMASGPAPEFPDHLVPLFDGSAIYGPQVVGLFGPNAAGKSNLLRALSFVSWFVQHSFALQPENEIPCFRFNTVVAREDPVEITIGFSAPTQLSAPIENEFCRYEYSIVLGGGNKQPSRVLRECLFYWPPGAARRSRVFERNGQSVLGSHAFRIQGYNVPLKSILRPNVSLISTLVQLGHSEAVALRDISKLISSNIFWALAEYHDSQVSQIYQSNPDLVVGLNRNIQRLDLGILEVKVNKADGQNIAQTTFLHDGLADPIPSHLESHGTRRFVGIFPTISAALNSGGIAVVDEIDTSIHPHVLPEIVGWFYDRSRNPKGAQLWFTAQNPYLLSSLAKEEVFFCEKNHVGSTTAFGLSSIKSVRRIDNYVNKYLGGVYGAVPHFG